MKIVTGYTGTPHISSNDDQGRNQGIFGGSSCVLDVGNKFAATMTDANTLTIQDGEGMLQGVHFRVDPGSTNTVNIANGTTGYNRIDLVCVKYTKEATTGVEAVEWEVIQGTPDASTPSAPSYTAGDILSGDTLAEFPMFKVTLTGLTPSVTALFDVFRPLSHKGVTRLTISGDIGDGGVSEIVSTDSILLEAGHLYIADVKMDITTGSNGASQTAGAPVIYFTLRDFDNSVVLFIDTLFGPNNIQKAECTPIIDMTNESTSRTIKLRAVEGAGNQAYILATTATADIYKLY